MRWMKLNLDDDHDLGLSQFEIPWMSAISDEEVDRAGDCSLLIKYLGSDRRICTWESADHRSKVHYQRNPLKVMRVDMPMSACVGDQQDVVVVLDQFLRKELTECPDVASKYLALMKEVIHKSWVASPRAALTVQSQFEPSDSVADHPE